MQKNENLKLLENKIKSVKIFNNNELFNSKIRYLGYSCVIGELFRGIIPKSLLKASYLLSLSYITYDVYNSTLTEFKTNKKPYEYKLFDSFSEGTNALVWQILATGAIPIFILSQSVRLFSKIIFWFTVRKSIVKLLSIGCSVSLIPFFPVTVDPLVTKTLNIINGFLYNNSKNM